MSLTDLTYLPWCAIYLFKNRFSFVNASQLAAHVNQLTADYQGAINMNKRRVEDARKIAVEATAKFEQAEQETAALRTKLKLAGEQIKVLENSKKKKDQAIQIATKNWEEAEQKLGEANKNLAEANRRKEAEIFEAVVGAKRDVTKKYHARIAKARKCFEEIDDEALVSMRDLFEMKSNLSLLSTLQEDGAPSLEDEVKNVLENMENVKGADERFNRLMSGLKEALTADPTDELAASVGIGEPTGSNQDAPGIAEFAASALIEHIGGEPSAAEVGQEETLKEFMESVQKDAASGMDVMLDCTDLFDDDKDRGGEANVEKEVTAIEGVEVDKGEVADPKMGAHVVS